MWSSNLQKMNWRGFFDWGITPEEKNYEFPCDQVNDPPHTLYYRGITVKASAERLFSWLCQMRVAPYSYDWLDNLGRRSPRKLTPGMTQLASGQVFMTGFELVDFEPNLHITIRSRDLPIWMFIFGDIAITYMIVSRTQNHCRLLVKMRVAYPKGPVMKSIMRLLLPPGDTFMMYKQLRTFRELAETKYENLV